MAVKKLKRIITAALPYTNNIPHIGNIVGSHLPADIFSRYCRLNNYETIFIGGTDEHGTASEIAAKKAKLTPKQLCDFYYKIHKKIYDWWDFSYDNFSRTSKPIHHKTTQDFFKKIYKNKFIEEQTLKLPFCNPCQKQLADRYIEGTCPHCKYEKARGDQCEHCSKLLDPIQLKRPYCSICNSKDITFKNEKHLFLKLDKIQPKLKSYITNNKQLRQQVKNLALAWIREGLKPRCITRDLKWGVKVPIKGYENKVLYVWFDAPIGYISSTKEWNIKKWKQFWQNPKSQIYHFIGKDNIPFHTIFFPGMLLANGDYQLAHNVVGLQYCNYEKQKISKSQSHGIFCENLPNINLEADYWRFYSTFLIPETKDTDFLWKEFQERINNELIDNIGNLLNRTLTFTKNKFNSTTPKPKITTKDKIFIKKINKEINNTLNFFEKVKLREALENILRISNLTNQYFQNNEPWKNKTAPTTIYICLNICEKIALLLQPYIPTKSKEMLELLNSKQKDFKNLKTLNIKEKHKIKQPKILFNKLENNIIQELKQKTTKPTQYFKKNENKMTLGIINYTSIEDFKKFDIRIGTIKEVKNHPKANKLYILKIKLNEEPQREIIANLKKNYKKNELLGKQISIITNLKPITIKGITSNGMLLAAVDRKDNVSLLTVDKKIADNSKVL